MLYVSKSLETFTCKAFSITRYIFTWMFHTCISVDIQQSYLMIPKTITRGTHNSKTNQSNVLQVKIFKRYPKSAEKFTGVFHDFGSIQKMCVRNSQGVFRQSGDIHNILSKIEETHVWRMISPERLTKCVQYVRWHSQGYPIRSKTLTIYVP